MNNDAKQQWYGMKCDNMQKSNKNEKRMTSKKISIEDMHTKLPSSLPLNRSFE